MARSSTCGRATLLRRHALHDEHAALQRQLQGMVRRASTTRLNLHSPCRYFATLEASVLARLAVCTDCTVGKLGLRAATTVSVPSPPFEENASFLCAS